MSKKTAGKPVTHEREELVVVHETNVTILSKNGSESTTDTELPDYLMSLAGVQKIPDVLDYLYIKTIERRIGRKIHEYELEAARFGEPVFFEDQFGTWDTYKIPKYRMPTGLQHNLIDVTNAMVAIALWKRIQGAA